MFMDGGIELTTILLSHVDAHVRGLTLGIEVVDGNIQVFCVGTRDEFVTVPGSKLHDDGALAVAVASLEASKSSMDKEELLRRAALFPGPKEAFAQRQPDEDHFATALRLYQNMFADS